jgi:hypothetical protein
MRRIVFLLALLLAGTFLSASDYAIEQGLNATQSLADSEELGVQAAADAVKAAKLEKEAREHFRESLETRDPDEITRAVELRPLDVRYRAYQVALLIAYSDDPSWAQEQENSAAALRFILASASDTGRMGESERLYFLSFYLPALQEFFDDFGQDSSVSSKFKKAICSVRHDLTSMGTPMAERILEANPDNANCPPG